jgi:hypothetical protein
LLFAGADMKHVCMLPTCVQTPENPYNSVFEVRFLAKGIVGLLNQNYTVGSARDGALASCDFAPAVFDQFNVNSNDCRIALSLGKSAHLLT